MSTNITFALRGTASPYAARYAPGGTDGTAFNSGIISSAAGGLSGTIIDLTNTSGIKFLSYSGVYNTSNSRAFSILIRCAPNYNGTPAGTRSLFCLSSGVGTSSAYVELRHEVTTGKLTLTIKNELAAISVNALAGNTWSPVSGTYYDIVITWDGTTSANAVNWYLNTANIHATAAAALSVSWANTWWKSICIGSSPNATASAFKLDEFVIWDGIIDVNNVALVSGNGALNGASRTSLVDVSAFDGTVNIDPGIANVKFGTSYEIDGVTKTGILPLGAQLIGPTRIKV